MQQYMDTLRWDDLRIFLVAHEAGTFSAAARALETEQSTVSRRIAALEGALGTPLFLRSRTGLVLTEQGERILPLAREARLRIQELAAVARSGRVEGTVRIALTESLAVYGMAAVLGLIFDEHPGLQVKLISGMSVSDLGRSEADLALRLYEPMRGDLVSTCAAQMPNALWGHRRWQGHEWEDLEWVDLDTDISPDSWVRRHAPRAPRLTTNGYIGMVEALRHGIGVSILPDSVARQMPELARIESAIPPPPPTPVFLVAHRVSRHVPKIAAVWTFLELQMQALANDPARPA